MRALLPALAMPVALALVQQQLLLRQPPRLLALQTSDASSGPATLNLRFSRPMERASLAALSRLDPAHPARWLGSGSTFSLTLEPGTVLNSPINLSLAGRDRRGAALRPSQWQWDPRPRLLAVVNARGGEQLQLQQPDGRWQAVSPVWRQILGVEPLGDGSGVAVVSRGQTAQIWRLPLGQGQGPPQQLGSAGLFAHLSSNRRGELLIQSGGLEPGSSRTQLWPRGQGRPRLLQLEASGPMRLLPQGGAVVVPTSDGLSLHDLPPRPPRQQTLPGSRDLSSFCPRAGRALLVRHWPDFRRSLELVEPGQPPRQLWIGPEAVLASSCSGNGDRLWLALVQGTQRPELTLLKLDRLGQVQARRSLHNWELEPGTGLQFDPVGDRLLLVLRRLSTGPAAPSEPEVVLIDADTLTLTTTGKRARLALWLPPVAPVPKGWLG